MGLQRNLRFPEDPDSQSSLGIDSLITPARRQIADLPEGFGLVGASSPVHQPGPRVDGGSISASSSWLTAIEEGSRVCAAPRSVGGRRGDLHTPLHLLPCGGPDPAAHARHRYRNKDLSSARTCQRPDCVPGDRGTGVAQSRDCPCAQHRPRGSSGSSGRHYPGRWVTMQMLHPFCTQDGNREARGAEVPLSLGSEGLGSCWGAAQGLWVQPCHPPRGSPCALHSSWLPGKASAPPSWLWDALTCTGTHL